MVVRPSNIELDVITDMPTKSLAIGHTTDKQRHSPPSMSRKYVSMSPARVGVPRSKSMNGLNRLDANKINENGRTQNHSTRRQAHRPQQRDISSSENGSPNLYNGGLSNGRHSHRDAESLENIAMRSSDSAPSTPEDNINVVVRVRPLNEKEQKCMDPSVVTFPGSGQILCEGLPGGPGGGQKPKLFGYNVVFEPGASQSDVVEYSGIKRIIEMAIEGFSCTAFCYGQTGSGKTHTLTGPPELFVGKPEPTDSRHGLIFRAFLYLFQLLQERKDTNFVLKASFLEIYNEKVIDLLNTGSARKPLAVRWSKKSRGFFVENLFTVDCEELDDLLAVLEEGMRNRSVGSHRMNDYSSRSHTILTVHITSEHQAEGSVFISKQGKVNFVDLAGSEMTKKTNSEGKTLEEANNINKSLMVLGYCIASLSDSKKRSSHIPYRDSQLTKLLADSLAGNGVTLMVACVSPARSNISETLNTLRYAARAKKIRTKPVVVMDPREALILSLKREINALKAENEHLKSALHLHSNILENAAAEISHERREIPVAPKVDLERMTELEVNEIIELVKLYIAENEALRTENAELFNSRDMILRDQEIVCRENERLLKKLEDVNSVCCRSPIIPARPTFSAEMLNAVNAENGDSNIWTNPLATSHYSTSMDNISHRATESLDGRVSSRDNHPMPESVQRELDKRRIGDSIQVIANTLRRHNSWDTQPTQPASAIRLTPKGSADNSNVKRSSTSSTPKHSASTTSKSTTPIESKSATPIESKSATPNSLSTTGSASPKPETLKPATPKPATPKPATPKPATPKPTTPESPMTTRPMTPPKLVDNEPMNTIDGIDSHQSGSHQASPELKNDDSNDPNAHTNMDVNDDQQKIQNDPNPGEYRAHNDFLAIPDLFGSLVSLNQYNTNANRN